MLLLVGPIACQYVHPFDAGNLENAVVFLIYIVSPYINVIVREAEGFHDSVPNLTGIG